MKFCYADPPYLGCARRYYRDKHPAAALFDLPETHRDLIARMCDEFPDGWALSCHSPSLQTMLSFCPPRVRVGAWIKPFVHSRPGQGVRYSWEPLIVFRGRHRPKGITPIRDWVIADRRQLKSEFPGAKPREFVSWVLDWLHVLPGDEPCGSVPRIWRVLCERRRLPGAGGGVRPDAWARTLWAPGARPGACQGPDHPGGRL